MTALLSRNSSGQSQQDDIWLMQSRAICELAEKGSCVIVGRCADYVLREKADCLRVFIHADMKWGDARNYHISLDSSVVGIEKCAQIIADLYKNFGEN